MHLIRIAALAICSTLLLSSTSQAASYGNFIGTTVIYEAVTDGPLGLYGAPTISGDSLDFSPPDYSATCTGGPGCPSPVLTDEALLFHVQAKPGSFIGSITLSEAGDTTLTAFEGAQAFSSIAAPVRIQVEEIDGVPLSVSNPGLIISTPLNTGLTFNSGGNFQNAGPSSVTQAWNGSLLVDVDLLISLAGLSGRATRVDFVMDNALTAFATGEGATARIAKKDTDALTITVIPEPTTGLLIALGLTGLAAVRRSPR
jgi:hypothetical protein